MAMRDGWSHACALGKAKITIRDFAKISLIDLESKLLHAEYMMKRRRPDLIRISPKLEDK